jgi:DNA-binding CsgD family transcriptional regulator
LPTGWISPKTQFKGHGKHIFAKLGVQDRTRAATIAIARGII